MTPGVPAYLLKYTSAANHGLFEEGELFGFYVNICQVNASNDRLWLSLHALCSAYPLLGMYLCLPLTLINTCAY